jgi:hypothetical protein
MPAPETAYRMQTAVLWEWAGKDGYNEPRVNAPEEVRVRWVWGQKAALTPEGGTKTVDATATVDRDIPTDSLMWLGTLDDWLGTGSGGEDKGVMQVATVKDTPDLKGRVSRREVGLVFFRDQMPTVV